VSQALSATATFLFTDIEGSTELATRLRERYPDVLAKHHELLEGVFASHGGQVVDTQGDAFFVAFPRPRDALAAAAEVQRVLDGHSWPDGVTVRVRVGIHTGEANMAGERYVGLTVHRAARISAVGHGGQVLVSQTTANLVEDDIDHLDGLALTDLGERQLKDIARPVRIYQLDVDGLRKDFPPLKAPRPQKRGRRRIALVAVPLVAAGAAAALFLLLGSGSSPPAVLPDSLVRYDPETLEPTDVVEIGPGADLVVTAGNYVWITHYLLRDEGSGALREGGDRILTRVDTRTNEAVVVGGGLAPCGLAPEPSGDVWVANCFGVARPSTLVRVAAESLAFKATWPIPGTDGFVRGVAYGGGSLWVSDPLGGYPDEITQIDPRTGRQRTIAMPYQTGNLAWSEGYGDLWGTHFDFSSVTRLHAATSAVQTTAPRLINPASLAVAGDAVWIGDWALPRISRLRAVGAPTSRVIDLPSRTAEAGVWVVAAGEGAVWATVPRDGRLWRIDAETDKATPIDIPHLPTGVAVGNGAVWVVVRGR
jgi:class 3 adenylate cyclase/sugar lactone lactonase YvrE